MRTIKQFLLSYLHFYRHVSWGILGGFFVMLSTSAAGLEQLAPASELKGFSQAIPKTFFGMHTGADTTIAWPVVKFGSLRLWDSYVTWYDLEPEKGKWNFKRLDHFVEMAEQNKVEVLLPLGMTPKWASSRPTENSAYGLGYAAEPANMEDWRNYVRTVAKRYKGRIHYYEIWNEPNLNIFFTGDMAKMVELTRIANEEFKKVDPGIRVVSPGVGNIGKRMQWLDDFFRLGGGAYIDIVAYHFYVPSANPEAILGLARDAHQVMKKYNLDDKPLWNTESGWWIANEDGTPDNSAYITWKKLDHSNAGAFIARAHILAWAAGVERYYWYSWGHGMTGLIEPTTKALKQHAVSAYARTIKWLQGSVIKGCNKTAMVWNCALVDQKGRNAWLVWTEEEKGVSWDIPTDWRITESESLDGSIKTLVMNHQTTLAINQNPLMLRSWASVR